MKALKRLKAEKLKRQKAGTGTGIKMLTPNKLLTRLPLLLPQVKTENN